MPAHHCNATVTRQVGSVFDEILEVDEAPFLHLCYEIIRMKVLVPRVSTVEGSISLVANGRKFSVSVQEEVTSDFLSVLGGSTEARNFPTATDGASSVRVDGVFDEEGWAEEIGRSLESCSGSVGSRDMGEECFRIGKGEGDNTHDKNSLLELTPIP